MLRIVHRRSCIRTAPTKAFGTNFTITVRNDCSGKPGSGFTDIYHFRSCHCRQFHLFQSSKQIGLTISNAFLIHRIRTNIISSLRFQLRKYNDKRLFRTVHLYLDIIYIRLHLLLTQTKTTFRHRITVIRNNRRSRFSGSRRHLRHCRSSQFRNNTCRSGKYKHISISRTLFVYGIRTNIISCCRFQFINNSIVCVSISLNYFL